MTKRTLLGLSGALRTGSTNSMLVREAARLFGDCTLIEGDLRLPLYDGDLEEADGIPESVTRLASQIADADGVIISTPEYNKGPPGVLKNALDWVSRAGGHPWSGKPVAVMSAAAGRAGGERAQLILRTFLVPFRPVVLPGPEIHLAGSSREFDDDGHLTSEIYTRELTGLMAGLRAEIDRKG
ncbi:MAG: NAD(P)H-dependent oxidoreductase [Pseudomonadota bacterium]